MRLLDDNLAKFNNLWQQNFAPHYDALAESEQRIIKVAAILLPMIIFVFGIALPISDKNSTLKQDVNTLSVQVFEAKRLAQQLEKQPQEQAGNNTNLLSHVDSLARQGGVRKFMTRLRPQPVMSGKQQLQTQIKKAPYANIASFIINLETSGLTITQIKIQAVSAGIVNMQATIGQ